MSDLRPIVVTPTDPSYTPLLRPAYIKAVYSERDEEVVGKTLFIHGAWRLVHPTLSSARTSQRYGFAPCGIDVGIVQFLRRLKTVTGEPLHEWVVHYHTGVYFTIPFALLWESLDKKRWIRETRTMTGRPRLRMFAPDAKWPTRSTAPKTHWDLPVHHDEEIRVDAQTGVVLTDKRPA